MSSGKHTETNMMAMLSHRMGWNVGEPKATLLKCGVSKLNDEEAVLFVITPDRQPLIIRDNLHLYPSDTLVTQLRLLEKN